MVAADFTGDGAPDLVVSQPQIEQMVIYTHQ